MTQWEQGTQQNNLGQNLYLQFAIELLFSIYIYF
jgi:hypothetical protein